MCSLQAYTHASSYVLWWCYSYNKIQEIISVVFSLSFYINTALSQSSNVYTICCKNSSTSLATPTTTGTLIQRFFTHIYIYFPHFLAAFVVRSLYHFSIHPPYPIYSTTWPTTTTKTRQTSQHTQVEMKLLQVLWCTRKWFTFILQCAREHKTGP